MSVVIEPYEMAYQRIKLLVVSIQPLIENKKDRQTLVSSIFLHSITKKEDPVPKLEFIKKGWLSKFWIWITGKSSEYDIEKSGLQIRTDLEQVHQAIAKGQLSLNEKEVRELGALKDFYNELIKYIAEQKDPPVTSCFDSRYWKLRRYDPEKAQRMFKNRLLVPEDCHFRKS